MVFSLLGQGLRGQKPGRWRGMGCIVRAPGLDVCHAGAATGLRASQRRWMADDALKVSKNDTE
jgi:hypothetical protein